MARHIHELKIEALRGIRGLGLPQLGHVNLLVGDNNSGKTTVLEALALFCRPLDPLEWLAAARRRNVKSSRESVLEGVRWLFPQDKANLDDPYYEGRVQIDGKGVFPCLQAGAHFDGFGADEEDSESFDRDAYEEESSSSGYDEEESYGSLGFPARGADITLSTRVPTDRWLEFDASPDNGRIDYEFELFEDERFITRDPARDPKLDVVTISPFSHRVEQLQMSRLSEATLSETAFNVLQCLRLIDPGIQELEILSRSGVRPTLWVRHETTGYSPIYTLGDGVRRILTMALGLIEAQNGVLLIDEIETAIHKDALVDVFQWLVQAAAHFNVQLFATTHSLEAVDAVLLTQLDNAEQLVAYHLPEAGGRCAKRFAGELLDNLRFERGLDIR